MLAVVNGSPLLGMTSKSLAKTTATGNADIQLNLNLPLFNLERSKVMGSITLAGNDVQITPESPLLARAKGLVTFNESGFAIKGAQASYVGRRDAPGRRHAERRGPDDPGLVFKPRAATAEAFAKPKN